MHTELVEYLVRGQPWGSGERKGNLLRECKGMIILNIKITKM